MELSLSRRNALLASGYGVVLGAYFGLVIGLRMNPDFLDHWRAPAYGLLLFLFAVGLHASRSLSALAAWTAYVLCCGTYALVAAGFEGVAGLGSEDVMINTGLIAGLFGLGGFVAYGLGRMVRRYLLPSPETTSRLTKGLLPWFPLIVLAAMTFHTIERHREHARIRTQRDHSSEGVTRLRSAVFSLVAHTAAVRVDAGDLIVTAALPKETFARGERIDVILVFRNEGPSVASIPQPRTFAESFTLTDGTGKELSFDRDAEWNLNHKIPWELYCGARQDIRIAPGEHAGMFVSLQPSFSLDQSGTYALRLNWGGKVSALLKFIVR